MVERGISVTGVVDKDPEKVGRSVAELTGLPVATRVVANLSELRAEDADAAVFSTKSRIADIREDVLEALQMGWDVVTTSEEMAYPKYADPEGSVRLNQVALEKDVTLIGVGVNPGFVMDWVPAVVASAACSPTSIHVVRSVDVSRRRRQLQAKTGVGHSKARFEKELKEGLLGHVGLIESAHLIARSIGFELKDLKHGVYPVLGSEGYVMGVRQYAEGTAGRCLIRLDLEMSMTSADFDVVEVKGDPELRLRFEKGVFGDSATVALVVHAVERISKAPPGLITVLDLPLSVSREPGIT